jgi:hypothetical protein
MGTFEGSELDLRNFRQETVIPLQSKIFLKRMPDADPSKDADWDFRSLQETLQKGLIAHKARQNYGIKVFACHGFMNRNFENDLCVIDDQQSLATLVRNVIRCTDFDLSQHPYLWSIVYTTN